SIFFDRLKKDLTKSRVSEKNLPQPLKSLLDYGRSHAEDHQSFQRRMANQTEIDEYTDSWTESFVDAYMGTQFRKYFIRKLGLNEQKLAEVDRKVVEDRVSAAIAATKGIRPYNVFSPDFQFPRNVPIQVLMGSDDTLNPVPLLKEYEVLLEQKGIRVTSTLLRGAGHLFPQQHPDKTATLILRNFEPIWQQYRATHSIWQRIRLNAKP
ncbi:MAG: alpha/beta hydrolase, partial [Oligoflexia bacterium]|nr:alpha/beta hydrolase [Oligoflexia bacterium]